MRPQRNLERWERLQAGEKQSSGVLEAFNERQTTRILHPTKGWRTISARRSRAQYATEMIKRGQLPLSPFKIKAFIMSLGGFRG
jgi:hypothetical protein